MKTINYRHQVEVIETYEIEYTLEDFMLDVQYYEIDNLTYEELQEYEGPYGFAGTDCELSDGIFIYPDQEQGRRS